MNQSQDQSPPSIVREMFRCVVGDEKIDYLVKILDGATTSVEFDASGLRNDLITLVKWLREIGGLDYMSNGNPLVKLPAMEAIVDLAELIEDAPAMLSVGLVESDGLRQGVKIEAQDVAIRLFQEACTSAFEAVINGNDYPPEEPILEACADELNYLARGFKQAGDDQLAEACAKHEANIRKSLQRMPSVMESLTQIEKAVLARIAERTQARTS